MEINWDEVKWIFESDGFLNDLYIQDTSWDDWEKVINFLNSNYNLEFVYDGDKKVNEIESKIYMLTSLTIKNN